MDNLLEKLKYPIGKFQRPTEFTPAVVEEWIKQIEVLPQQLRAAVQGWSEEQLDTPYRQGGWTVRQLIHHIADSHLNSYVRFKWSLTEDTPTIKAYEEKLWAELPEARTAPANLSIDLLDTLHRRWVMMLRNLTPADLEKAFVHPESRKTIPLGVNIALYAWHSRHHLQHILNLKERQSW